MYYRQPRYFEDFHCVGGSCPNSCCVGWRIDWKKEEIDKIKNAENASPEMIELCENSFEELKQEQDNTHTYKIKLDKNGRCPFLTSDNFCKIQRELGVEYMSDTCTIYPRKYITANDVLYKSCYMSCKVIIDRILSDEKAMDLVNIPVKEPTSYSGVFKDSPQQLERHPELKYREEIFEFFYKLISDKKHDVETNIILGALVAQSLTNFVGKGEYNRIPEALQAFNKQIHNGTQLKMLEHIKTNYFLRFGFIEKLSTQIIQLNMSDLLKDKTGTPNIEIYRAAEKKLSDIFKDCPFIMRNIALNLLFEFKMPIMFWKKSIFENYGLFVASYAVLKLNLIAAAIPENIKINHQGQHFEYEGFDRFAGVTAIICRSICQNIENAKKVINSLNEHKFTTPAYLALLVK